MQALHFAAPHWVYSKSQLLLLLLLQANLLFPLYMR